jgi:hypothetical protein
MRIGLASVPVWRCLSPWLRSLQASAVVADVDPTSVSTMWQTQLSHTASVPADTQGGHRGLGRQSCAARHVILIMLGS